LSDAERVQLRDLLNSERFADCAPRTIYATLLDEQQYYCSWHTMTSKAVAELLIDLGVAKTHSRPHVSNDNPFSEAQFKTLKYRPSYPDRFGSLLDARHHAVISGLTPRLFSALDDLLRLAGSLSTGTVQTESLIRTLQRGDRPTKLGRALQELGWVIKTLFVLNYIDDAAYRRRILTQLNRGEGRHKLARVVFYGQRGELRQRYREGQENQLTALGLVVNAIIVWNTLYLERALDSLRAAGHAVRDEDVARLSPLVHEHVNVLGRYSFSLPDNLQRGEWRPLRVPVARQ
jgi:hypothetical protein